MPGNNGGRSNKGKYSMTVLGEPAVGKTAILIRFFENNFSTEYRRLALSSGQKKCVIDGVPATLDILEAAGARKCTELQEYTMEFGEGFLLVFSVTDLMSFAEIQELHRHICVIKNHDQFPMVMVGNKADIDSERNVSVEEAKNLASRLRIPYIECSAESGMNVEHAFHELVRIIRKFKMSKEQIRTNKKY